MHLRVLRRQSMLVPFTLMGLRGTTLVVKFLLSIFVAKFLGLVELSVYGLIMATAIAAPPVLGLGLSQTISRRAVTLPPEDMVRPVLFYALYVAAINFTLTSLVAAIGFERFSTAEIYMIGAIVLFEHINNDAYQLQINLSRNLMANILHFVRAALWAFVFMVTAFVRPELRTIDALLGMWLVASLTSGALFALTLRDWPWRQALRDLARLPRWIVREAKEAFPLYISGFSMAVSMQADKYIVSFFLGLELAGVYIFFWQIYSAINNLIFVSIIQPARPRLIRQFKVSMAAFAGELRKTLRNASGVAFGLAAMAGAVTYFLVPHLENHLLATWRPLIGVILFACALQSGSEALRLGFYARHEDRKDRNITLGVVVLMVALYTSLLWLFGIWGGALALVGVTGGRMLMQVLVLRPIWRVKPD